MMPLLPASQDAAPAAAVADADALGADAAHQGQHHGGGDGRGRRLGVLQPESVRPAEPQLAAEPGGAVAHPLPLLGGVRRDARRPRAGGEAEV